MKPIRVRVWEQLVFNEPPGMAGWRFYRIEYQTVDDEVAGGSFWLPPHADPDKVVDLLNAYAYQHADLQ